MSSSAQPSAGLAAFSLDAAPDLRKQQPASGRGRSAPLLLSKVWMLQQEQSPMQMPILQLSVAHWMASGWQRDFRCQHFPIQYMLCVHGDRQSYCEYDHTLERWVRQRPDPTFAYHHPKPSTQCHSRTAFGRWHLLTLRKQWRMLQTTLEHSLRSPADPRIQGFSEGVCVCVCVWGSTISRLSGYRRT